MSDARIILAGKNRVAVDCLNRLIESPEIDRDRILVLPVTADDGTDTWQPSLRAEAKRQQISVTDISELSRLSGTFISTEYDRILPVDQFGCLEFFNIHFSLLPAFKGCWTAILPILFGKETTGVTIHRMDAGVDTGPIIAQDEFSIDSSETASSLYEKLMSKGVELFAREIKNLLDGNFSERNQPLTGSSYYSRSAIDLKNTEISLQGTFEQIDRRIRAYFFPQFQTATFRDRRVSAASLHDGGVHHKTGSVVGQAASFTLVQCVDAVIKLHHQRDSDD